MTTYTNVEKSDGQRHADRTMLVELGMLNKKVAVCPDDIDAWIARGHLHLSPFLADRSKASRGLADFEQAISLCPESSEAWRGKGRALFMRGLYSEAIEALTRAVELSNENVLALLYRGICSKRIGEMAQAEIDLRQVAGSSEYPDAARLANLILEKTTVKGEK